MKKKSRGLIVASLIAFGAMALIVVLQPRASYAEEKEVWVSFVPLINNQVGPSLAPFINRMEAPAVVTEIIDPGDGLLRIATRDGRIRISTAEGDILPEPMLDLTDKVYDDGNEMGLVGMVAHPDFATNGYLYVYYTEREIDDDNRSSYYAVLSRFNVEPSGQADRDSEMLMMRIALPSTMHHGGSLQFGPHDGYLYISVGDGGTARDREGNAQSTETLLGKILRIDVNTATPYAIPPDNPFVNSDDSRGEIWHLGFRNPWKISFDSVTGDLYIADVGQTTWEEVNFVPAGQLGGLNFGWPCMEGPAVFEEETCDPDKSYEAPVFSYERGVCGAVIGGYVYRGTQTPSLEGQYLLADLCEGRMWGLQSHDGQTWQATDYGSYWRLITAFGQRSDGELFVGTVLGNVLQIVGANPSS